jgi:hypothetical protein
VSVWPTALSVASVDREATWTPRLPQCKQASVSEPVGEHDLRVMESARSLPSLPRLLPSLPRLLPSLPRFPERSLSSRMRQSVVVFSERPPLGWAC